MPCHVGGTRRCHAPCTCDDTTTPAPKTSPHAVPTQPWESGVTPRTRHNPQRSGAFKATGLLDGNAMVGLDARGSGFDRRPGGASGCHRRRGREVCKHAIEQDGGLSLHPTRGRSGAEADFRQRRDLVWLIVKRVEVMPDPRGAPRRRGDPNGDVGGQAVGSLCTSRPTSVLAHTAETQQSLSRSRVVRPLMVRVEVHPWVESPPPPWADDTPAAPP